MSLPRLNPEEHLDKLQGLRFYGKDGWKPFVVDGKINPAAPVTSRFGLRSHPVHGGVRQHNGLDIGFQQGTRLAWKGTGNVESIQDNPQGPYGGYGNLTLFQPQGDTTKFKFAHLDKLPSEDLSKFGLVDLGIVGSTGVSTGPHLHLEALQTGRLNDTGAKPSQSPTTATAPQTANQFGKIVINIDSNLLGKQKENEQEEEEEQEQDFGTKLKETVIRSLFAQTFGEKNKLTSAPITSYTTAFNA